MSLPEENSKNGNSDDVAEKARVLLVKMSDMKMQMEMLLEEKERALPPEVQQMIKDRDAEFQPKIELLEQQLKEFHQELEKAVVACGKTVKGLRYQAVYLSPKPVWDSDKLEGYAAAHPEILQLKTMGKAGIQLRKVSSKK